jgi:ABC-type transport system substrate-binding protein
LGRSARRVRSGRRFGALAVAATVAVAACGGDDNGSSSEPEGTSAAPAPSAAPGSRTSDAPSDGAPTRGGVLRAASAVDVTTLDPHAGTSGYDYWMIYPIYDTLLGYDAATLEPQPGLAESWTLEDPTALTLTLREGVTFHDGTPFDAAAVEYNLDRVKGQESNIKNDLATLESVEVVDDHTVTLNLSEPNSAMLGILADRAGMMVSPTAAEAAGEDFASNPVGTGPFKFVEHRPGELIKYEANPDYWNPELPYLDGIEYRILAEADTRLNGLLSDEVDFVHRVEPQTVEQVESNEELAFEQYVGIGDAKIIYMDTSKPPFDDQRLRQAVNYALDRETLTDAATFGTGEPAFMPIPSAHWAYQDELAPGYEYDPDKARALMAEAGVDGLSFSLVHQPDAVDTRVAEIVQAQLAESGIDVALAPVELTQSVQEYFTDRKYSAGNFGWTGRPDPNMTFSQIFSSDAFFNAGKYEIEGLPELLAEAAATTDIETRDEVYSRLVPVTLEASIIAPLFFRSTTDAFSANVTGYEPNLLSKPRFTTVSLGS